MAHLARNLLVGLAAGVAGTAAMDAYWSGLARLKPEWLESDEEPSTHKLARRVLRRAGVKSPSRQTRAVGGKAVHWSYGSGWGMAAGAARAAGVPLTWGGGQLFGAGLWALGDLWMLYQMDLAKHPREYPPEVHATALGAHLAYGLAAWATLKSLGGLADSRKRLLRRAA
ncbi:MAG: hypothetical protein ACTHJX_07205 [Terriglobales bacterium]